MPTFNILNDDSFVRANAGPGSGANSTVIGGGLTDYVGNLWQIQGNTLKATALGTNPPKNTAYNSNYFYRDGYAMGFGSGFEVNCVARFNPANGGSGYSAMVFNGSWFFYKLVNGVASAIGTTPVIGGTAPTNAALKMTFIGDGTTTQITADLYDQADLNTVLFTKTVSDSTPSLQGAGYPGLAGYNAVTYTRFQIAQVSAVLTPGVCSITYIGKTVATVTSTPPTGGSGALTYQWQRAQGAGSYSNISGATSLTRPDTGLTPGTLYYYRLVTTDSLGATVTSTAVAIITYAVGVIIYGFVGDSITFGLRIDIAPPVTMMQILAAARPDLYSPYCVNVGISGSTVQNWIDTNFASTIATLQAGEVNRVCIDLGTNDALASVPAATYGSRMATLIGKYLTPGTGITSVRLNEPFYNAGAALISQYPAQLDALENGTTILHGDRLAQGFFATHTEQLQTDGVHPEQPGANSLARLWVMAEVGNLPRFAVRTGGQLSGLIKTSGNL